jgi:cytochrome c oxidase cbb3-type subunit 1
VEELTMSTATIGQAYNYKVVRQFVVATIVWGVVGMAMGYGSPRNWYGPR